MLANWNPNTECAPHDHGFSEGIVWLFKGSFIENHYSLNQNLISCGPARVWPEGSVLRVTCGDIHSMRPAKNGMSLHIYSPPIHDMKVYDQINRTTLTVTNDCGAWIPTQNSKILHRMPWPS